MKGHNDIISSISSFKPNDEMTHILSTSIDGFVNVWKPSLCGENELGKIQWSKVASQSQPSNKSLLFSTALSISNKTTQNHPGNRVGSVIVTSDIESNLCVWGLALDENGEEDFQLLNSFQV